MLIYDTQLGHSQWPYPSCQQTSYPGGPGPWTFLPLIRFCCYYQGLWKKENSEHNGKSVIQQLQHYQKRNNFSHSIVPPHLSEIITYLRKMSKCHQAFTINRRSKALFGSSQLQLPCIQCICRSYYMYLGLHVCASTGKIQSNFH